MPTTDTLTNEQVVEILATKGMGWRASKAGTGWLDDMDGSGPLCWRDDRNRIQAYRDRWNPLADLNACHEVEERLSKNQRITYVNNLSVRVGGSTDGLWWAFTHATAPVKARALAEVLR